MELSAEQLSRLHQAQLHIATRVKQICDDHGIRYFLIAGTLLGAVRHSGFIPWDDDMDFGMPREDYDRFMRYAPEEMGPDLFLQSLQTDRAYGLSFAKVRLNGTKLIEAASAKTSAHNGIFIDIFPFDNMPNKNWQRQLHARFTSALKRTVLLKKGYQPWFASSRLKSFLSQSAVPLARLLPASVLVPLLDWSMRWFNSKPSELMTAIGGSYGYHRESIEKQWLGNLPETPFEGVSFRCPEAAIVYLTDLYGDYMVPPAPEQQNSRHGILGLDFGS